MEKIFVNKKNVWKTVISSWLWTAFSFITLFVIVAVIFFLLMRFIGPRVIMGAIISMGILSLMTFLIAEPLINIIMKAESPDPEKHKRFLAVAKKVKKESHMWFMPRLYILKRLDIPNAMAYGWGFFGQYAVGITQPLYDLLNEQELEGVVAHEFAHIKCKDIGAMSVIAMVTGGISKLSDLFVSGKTGLEKSFVAMIIGYALRYTNKYVFGIIRSAISQEREYTADALAALYTKNPQGLINALSKLSVRHAPNEKETILDDIMISHPRMEKRLDALRSYQQKY